jgi:tetratricopeptide (TPR) repeat protein
MQHRCNRPFGTSSYAKLGGRQLVFFIVATLFVALGSSFASCESFPGVNTQVVNNSGAITGQQPAPSVSGGAPVRQDPTSSKEAEENAPSRTDEADPLAPARTTLHEGMAVEAEQSVRKYLASHPESAAAHFLLGYILFREIQAKASIEGHPDTAFEDAKAKESLAEYTAGAKYRPPSASDLKVVALDYILLGDYLDADKWLSKSLQWNPNDSDGWYYLGRTRYNENRYQEAIAAFEQCLKLDPKNVKAEDNLGLSYAALGHTEDAIAAYRQAMAWQEHELKKEPGPFINFGILLLDQNRFAEAIPYFVQAIEISPQEPRAHEQLGKTYWHLDQLKQAQGELEKAVQLDPQNASLHYQLGQVYRKEGFTEKAKREIFRSSELNRTPSSPGDTAR